MGKIHAYDDIEDPHADANRMLSRRSPSDRTTSGLVSRDYQPRQGGPELVASWRLGEPPMQTELGSVAWEITQTDYTPLQNTILSPPYVTGINYSPAYLVACGRSYVDTDATSLSIELANSTLSGKPYETEIQLTNTEPEPFMTPLIEISPDRPDYEEKPWGSQFPEWILSAKVSEGSAYIDPGTNVQLWSE